jgi:hypothetical protein
LIASPRGVLPRYLNARVRYERARAEITAAATRARGGDAALAHLARAASEQRAKEALVALVALRCGRDLVGPDPRRSRGGAGDEGRSGGDTAATAARAEAQDGGVDGEGGPARDRSPSDRACRPGAVDDGGDDAWRAGLLSACRWLAHEGAGDDGNGSSARAYSNDRGGGGDFALDSALAELARLGLLTAAPVPVLGHGLDEDDSEDDSEGNRRLRRNSCAGTEAPRQLAANATAALNTHWAGLFAAP